MHYIENYSNFTVELYPPEGAEVWWDIHEPVSASLMGTRHDENGVYQVWLGGHKLTKEGKTKADELSLYYSANCITGLDHWLEWGVQLAWLEKWWVPATNVCIPYNKRETLCQPMSRELLIAYIEKLQNQGIPKEVHGG